MSRFEELDAKWWRILASPEQCPAVLGLAAFGDDEETEVTQLVRAEIEASFDGPFDGLLRLLKRMPAVMLVWLARKAGVAYDDNFWPNFKREVGVNIPLARRQEFVSVFERHARALMASYTPSPELGAQHLVGTMLFHAGMPLCHCQSFADACRWVERRAGLSDPESLEAGAELRDDVLGYPQLQNIPVLRRALAGPAGVYVCGEALNVIFEREGTSTNPRLTAALREAFANIGAGGPRRSARLPYLRLSADLCALEIVGPRQDASLLAGQGVVWVVNGKPHRCGREEEFVFRVSNETRGEVELRGLSGSLTCRRTFEFDLAKRPVPCLVFDAESRREKRIETPGTATLRSGNYWVVHAAQYCLSESESPYDWPDGRCAISQMTLRPGREVTLEGAPLPMRFQAALTPFLEPAGEAVRTDDAQNIHFGWSQLPEIWCPGATGELSRWVLNIYLDHADSPKVVPLVQGDVQGVFLRFRPVAKECLESLAPGLHHLRCVVTRGGRRAECEREFWYWAGLTGWEEGRQFNVSAMPANLHWPDCRGFDRNNGALRHKADGYRQHRLAFNINGQIEFFTWSRTGLFLESYERRAGLATAEEHPIPASFAADVHTAHWLRIWHVPARQAELRVNGQLVQRFAPGQTHAEVSLAHLATLFPQGGTLVLVAHGLETRLASFRKPLTPVFINLDVTDGYESLVLKFAEEVRWVRPRLRELIEGREIQFDGRRFGTSGHCLFASEQIPTVECANICDNLGTESQSCRISLDLPKSGWPSGIWVAELEVRPSEDQTWELVADERGGCACLVFLQPPDVVPTDVRMQAIWWAAGRSLASSNVPQIPPDFTCHTTALADLLAECEELLLHGYATAVWPRIEWIQSLGAELGRQAAALMDSDDGVLRARLLSAVARESEISPRSLLVTVPSLLASPANYYASLAGEDPLRSALRWCAEVSSQPTVSESLRNHLVECFQNVHATGLLTTLQHFRNFAAVVQNAGSGRNREFSRFDFDRHWRTSIGSITVAPEDVEWSECDLLGGRHAHAAIGCLLRRRQQGEGGNGLTQAASIFALADEFRRWLRNALANQSRFMPDTAWNHPWLDVDIPDDAFAGQCARFCSVFALAARASAAGWLKFSEVTSWLHHRPHGVSDTSKAVTTLCCLSPELLGYHLMFWELIIRTSPHD